MRLLLVEDHVPLADELLGALGRQGYAVDWLADGRDAAHQGVSEPYDLIILDLGLPGLPGLEVLAQWRAGGLTAPVLVLTARGSWAERIDGLKAGADDYLTKPFHPEELQLRIQALLRRSHGLANQPRLEAAGLHLDEGRQCVSRDGTEIQLTPLNFVCCATLCCTPSNSCPKVISPSISMMARVNAIPMSLRSTSITYAASLAARLLKPGVVKVIASVE